MKPHHARLVAAPLRLLGCLIKVPLGCLAFAAGGTAVLVVFLPAALGDLLRTRGEEWFADRYRGTVSLEEVRLGSLFSDQRLEGILLRDPDGAVVLEGRVHAPALDDLAFGEAKRWGPVRVELRRLVLVEDARGVTGLARALEREEPPAPVSGEADGDGWQVSLSGPRARVPRELEVVLTAAEVRWGRYGAEPVTLHDVALSSTVRLDGNRAAWTAEGHLATAPPGGAGSGEARAPILLRAEVEGRPGHGRPTWRLVMDGECLPVALLRNLFGGLGDVERFLGDEVRSAHLVLASAPRPAPAASPGGAPAHPQTVSDDPVVEAYLEDPALSLVLLARWDRAQRRLVSIDERRSSVSFAGSSPIARRVFRSVIPLAEDVELDPGQDALWVHLERFVLPLDADLARATADCALTARSATFRYAPALRDALALGGRQRLEAPLPFGLRKGALVYDGQSLPAGAPGSGRLELHGSWTWADDRCELVLGGERAPRFLVRRVDGELVVEPPPQQ